MKTQTAASLYHLAFMLTSDQEIANTLTGMEKLSEGWTGDVSPTPVHKLLATKLQAPAGRKQHEAIYLQLSKVDADPPELTAAHARLWQFMSLRFLPRHPQGMMQFQMELSIILDELAQPQKPLLQLVPG